jgi:tetraacyldisaccharide 4'-kinase
MIARIRRIAYQRNWLRQHHLPKPVLSVGNLTVGGTGKTPLVIWLAHQLHAKGKRVAILSRGYGRQQLSKNFMVSNGRGQVKEWRAAGDEPWMIAQNCPWAIVAVGPDRHRLGKWVLEQSFCDFFILDDGYQHMSLYRDLDVLLFDSMDINGSFRSFAVRSFARTVGRYQRSWGFCLHSGQFLIIHSTCPEAY